MNDINLKEHEAASQAKTAIFTRLKASGVAKVKVPYDGSGDDGVIESATAFGQDGTEIPLERALAVAIDEYVSDKLPDLWMDMHGSFGTVVFDVGQGRVFTDHHERYEDFTSEEMEL